MRDGGKNGAGLQQEKRGMVEVSFGRSEEIERRSGRGQDGVREFVGILCQGRDIGTFLLGDDVGNLCGRTYREFSFWDLVDSLCIAMRVLLGNHIRVEMIWFQGGQIVQFRVHNCIVCQIRFCPVNPSFIDSLDDFSL